MKIFVGASSTFDDVEQFNSIVLPYFKENPFKFDLDFPPTLYCKENTQVDQWIADLKIPVKHLAYDEVPEDTEEVILFWDGASKNIGKLKDRFPKAKVFSFTNKSLESFKGYIDQISNEKWREGAKALCNKLPNYFWVVAASSSGKYHPKISLGPGGLLRHTCMVIQGSLDLLDAEIFLENHPMNRDMAIIASAFHDCLKQGFDYAGQTRFDHPIMAADFVKENLKDYVDDLPLNIICQAIRRHMGRWTTSKYMPDVVLERPEEPFDKLIHTADYMASRKYMGGLESWK